MDVEGRTVSEYVAAQGSVSFNNDKCKVWNLGPGKPWYRYRLRDGGFRAALRERLGSVGG